MSTAAPDGGRSWSTRIEPELLGAVEGVLDSPDRRNAVSVEGEEVDLVDVLEASALGAWPRHSLRWVAEHAKRPTTVSPSATS